MGLCNSTGGGGSAANSAEDQQVKKQDKLIAQQNQKDHNEEMKKLKLLLLGAGESGKSTLFKQMNSIYGKGFTDEDKKSYVNHVRNNTMLCLKALADNCRAYGDLLPETEPVCAMISNIEEIDSVTSIEQQYVKQYINFWNDPTVQNAWNNRSDFQIYGCAEYFLNKLEEISAPDYLPTPQDILQTRVRTTGIVENQFTIDSNRFLLYDVGGQRNERKKWIHCFENVTAVIFVAAISEYDQRLFEDENTNRLDEALKLFDEISNSRWFKNTHLLLFLNKRDLFEEKIERIPLNSFFPEYTGEPHNAQQATQWITQQFVNRNKVSTKQIYTYVTCATDQDVIKNVFNSVKDIIIRDALENLGIA